MGARTRTVWAAVAAAFVVVAAAWPGGGVLAASSMSWHVQSTPDKIEVLGVGCATANDCFAVGDETSDSLPPPPTMHWNGHTWSTVATPAMKGVTTAALVSVTCLRSDWCTAVGNTGKDEKTYTRVSTLVEHWDGHRWQVQPSPSTKISSFLGSVSCASVNNCFAVGSGYYGGLLEHWNGSEWSMQAVPAAAAKDTEFGGVACHSASDCNVVGTDGRNDDGRILALHWNGAHWSVAPVAYPPGTDLLSELNSVSCPAANDCVAVGDTYNDSVEGLINYRVLAEHWNGHAWSIVKAVQPIGGTNNLFEDVSCTTAANCVAVGWTFSENTGITKPLIERMSGGAWSIDKTPSVAQPESYLYAVACNAPSTCTAGGVQWNASAHTLVERTP